MSKVTLTPSLHVFRVKARLKSHGQAMSYYKRAVKLVERTQGVNSTQLVSLYQGLGRVEQSKGDIADHEKAIQYFVKAHEVASTR